MINYDCFGAQSNVKLHVIIKNKKAFSKKTQKACEQG